MATAAETRERMNSIQRRCSSRETSQKRDHEQDDHREQGRGGLEHLAAHRRELDHGHRQREDDRGRGDGGRRAPGERAPVVRGPRRLQRAEQDRDQQHRLEPLAEEDREREPECDQRRRDALLGQRALDVVEPALDHALSSLSTSLDRRAVADPVAEVGEVELEVQDEVRVAQAQRDLGVLEVLEVRLARELVAALAITCPGRVDSLIGELAGDLDLVERLVDGHVLRRGRAGQSQRRRGRGEDRESAQRRTTG